MTATPPAPAAPPGYSNGNARVRFSVAGAATFSAYVPLVLLLTVHAIGWHTPRAYASGASLTVATLGGSIAALLGALVARRASSAARHLATALCALSLLASGSGYALWFAVERGALLQYAAGGLVIATGCLAGAALMFAARAHARPLAQLGVVAELLSPARAFLAAAAILALGAVLPQLGIVRRGALLGALVGIAALALSPLQSFLELERLPRRSAVLAGSAVAAALVALLAASALVPIELVRQHEGDIVYALHGTRGRHVVTRIQGGPVLFTNDVLVSASTDAQRFAEALAHPALATAERRARVLVLSPGTGSIEREVLRLLDVRSLTSVVPDASLWRLARSTTLLDSLGGGPIHDARLTRVQEEPAVFVARSAEHYDVVLADLGDPSSYREGKNYTVHVLSQLRARLAPGGVLALQVTSPLRTPGTHAGILATLRAAGYDVLPYRAPLPALGEWGFALASSAPRGGEPAPEPRLRHALPSGTSFVDAATLPGLFALPADGTATEASVSYLYDQPLVERYLAEEQALVPE